MQTNLCDSARQRAEAAEAERILRSCVHCGFCNATCPTYQELGDELDGPRGRIYLIKQFLERDEASERTRLHLDRCLSCRKLRKRRLGWNLLDSGALYRLLAFAAVNHGVDLTNEEALKVLAAHLDVQFVAADGSHGQRIILEGEEVTDVIRTEQVGAGASQVAALPAVRDALLQRQRAFLEAPGLVADGRDMGTVVFPDAPLKIFLTASAEERARRRSCS